MPEEFEIKTRKPKVIFWDIEISPSTGYVWNKWQTDVIEFVSEWYCMAWSVKYKGGKHITRCLADYDGYKPGTEDDRALVKELWEHLDGCELAIGHNADRFDRKKINVRFIEHGLPPPKPTASVDTLKVAKKHFAFLSNKLDDLGNKLGVGRKVKTGGFELWRMCMQGDDAAWARMKKYCKGDVSLLERIYDRMLPWIDNHPNLTIISEKEYGCRNCGSKNLYSRGKQFTSTGFRNRYQCNDCKAWMSGKHKPLVEIR